MAVPSIVPSQVRLLDPHTVNQIAAGEVVERPASVLKELVENALDAGARRIEIELSGSGKDRILVRDDGCGMSEADLVVAMKRHATSKIRRLEDLWSVTTLGFRGEALPSIASVSRLLLSTGVGDVRSVLRVEGGSMEPIFQQAGPRGTEVIVDDLFFNTPARLKFLKSDATELSACVDLVQKLAVVHPEVSFLLRHATTTLLHTSGRGELIEAVGEVWGRDVVRGLAELDHMESGVRVQGLISPPHMTKANRSCQWFFVNGRPIRSRQLQTALDLAYRMLTPEKRFPWAVLMVHVDPARVDVNVSPTKSEVKFQHEGAVFDAVRHAVKHALLQHGMIPEATGLLRAQEAAHQAYGNPQPHPDAWGTLLGAGGSTGPMSGSIGFMGPLSPTSLIGPIGGSGAFAPEELSLVEGGAPTATRPESPGANAFSGLLDGLRVIGQHRNAFILAENHQGLLIIDQHVAHERILFEQIRRQRAEGSLTRQPLLCPEVLELEPRQSALVRERLSEFLEAGFLMESFGDHSFLVREVPVAIGRRKPMGVLREIVEEVVGGNVGARASAGISAREAVWIMASCKMAVKAGDLLSIPEMEKLIYDLASTENPYLCPHGRPITLVVPHADLWRKFKR